MMLSNSNASRIEFRLTVEVPSMELRMQLTVHRSCLECGCEKCRGGSRCRGVAVPCCLRCIFQFWREAVHAFVFPIGFIANFQRFPPILASRCQASGFMCQAWVSLACALMEHHGSPRKMRVSPDLPAIGPPKGGFFRSLTKQKMRSTSAFGAHSVAETFGDIGCAQQQRLL